MITPMGIKMKTKTLIKIQMSKYKKIQRITVKKTLNKARYQMRKLKRYKIASNYPNKTAKMMEKNY